jgi:outer membrane protein OmpA-like peptidoglycan-associated protein
MSIEGRLAARDLLESLRADLRTARLPGIDLERLELQPVVPRPYRLTARRRDGRLFLAGFLATESDRAAIRELVQRRFPFDALADDLHLADGAPEGLLPAGRLALERLAALSEGEARIEDRTIRLSGRSLYTELAGRIRRDFGTGLPAGWTGSAEIAAAPDKPLDPDFCGDLISDAARREPVRFEPGKAELGPAALKAIAALADIMRRCGSARLMVDSTGEAEPARALAERRAGEVVAALAQHGVKAGVQTGAGKAAVAAKAPDEIAFEVSP